MIDGGVKVWGFWGLILSILTASCSINSNINAIASNRPYDLATKPIRSEAIAFTQEGETTLYMRINRAQLLYTRETTTSPFTAEISITIDTLVVTKNDTLKTESPQWFDLKMEFPRVSNKGYFICDLEDLNRNVGERIRVIERDYLVWDVERNKAIDPSNVEIGTTLMIHSPGVSNWEVYRAIAPQNLPAAPFSNSRNPLDTVIARPFAYSDGSWVVTDGCQLFYDNKTNISFVINGRRADFPKSINVDDLIESTRYIATRDEYSRLLSAEHPKLALDQFWLKCGDSADKSRKLLEIYYDRVEEANTFFSGIQEGWKTDRGMVHIVLGVPDKVRSDGWREVWFYGDEGSPNCVIFVFDKRDNRLDDNVYVLQRDGLYRNTWERVVTSWRNGRIQGD
ncbi:MAG: hypothetical protein CMB32_02075 [Euryarchaeota archaeon]|nr:hypothetical protein [Euryarchaeota archaeon]